MLSKDLRSWGPWVEERGQSVPLQSQLKMILKVFGNRFEDILRSYFSF